MTEQTPQQVPASIPKMHLPGCNVALMGPSGTGKTHALGTLVDSGIEVFYIGMEPGLETLLGYWRDRNLSVPANLHWAEMPITNVGFGELVDAAKKVNQLSLEGLAKMQDPDRMKHSRFVKLLETLNNFVDARTGENYGAVSEWDNTRAVVIDGLTGLSNAAMSLVIGGKPVKSMADWGIAQDQVERLLRMLCDNCPCWFVLIAHVERETDLVLGGVKLTVATLGKALPPKIPSMFSDVILTVRDGAKWSWDTASSLADVKTRNLPVLAGQTPSFAPIVAKWKNRQEQA